MSLSEVLPMPDIPITAATLRHAMWDPRYWQDGHPARAAFNNWVTEGWRSLEGSGLSTSHGEGMVFVRAYTSTRDGHTEHVPAHMRSRPVRSGSEEAAVAGEAGGAAGQDPNVVLAQSLLLTPRIPVLPPGAGGFFARPPYEVPPPRVGPAPGYMERIPNQSGKEAASDVPSWARGVAREMGESPVNYARRVIDQRYDEGAWRNPERARDLRKIQKYGQRAFRDPRTNLLDLDDNGA
jgi:hypothetical protein